jgi:hypothetical protein
MTSDKLTAADAARELNAGDPVPSPIIDYGSGCENSLARYCPDCNCRSCREWRRVRGWR